MHNQHAMVYLIRATRNAQKAAQNLSALTGNQTITRLDDIVDDLTEYLYQISGESCNVYDSKAWNLIRDDSLTDEAIADEILSAAK